MDACLADVDGDHLAHFRNALSLLADPAFNPRLWAAHASTQAHPDARGACFPLLKAFLLLSSSFLLKVSTLLLKALLLFQSIPANAPRASLLRFAPTALD